MPRKNRAVLNISLELKSELDTLKHPGQSYDGLIRQLVEFWKQVRFEQKRGKGDKKVISS